MFPFGAGGDRPCCAEQVAGRVARIDEGVRFKRYKDESWITGPLKRSGEIDFGTGKQMMWCRAMRGVWLFLLVGVCLVLVLPLVFLAREYAIRYRISRRTPLEDDPFFETFYSAVGVPADIPRRLRPIYARFFALDPLKIRPADRPPDIEDADTSELVTAIEREFGVSFGDADLEHIDGSFDSIVQYLASQRGTERHCS